MDYTFFHCPACDGKLKTLDPVISGRKIRCPKCGSPCPVPHFAGPRFTAPPALAPTRHEEEAMDHFLQEIVEEHPPHSQDLVDDEVIEDVVDALETVKEPTAEENLDDMEFIDEVIEEVIEEPQAAKKPARQVLEKFEDEEKGTLLPPKHKPGLPPPLPKASKKKK